MIWGSNFTDAWTQMTLDTFMHHDLVRIFYGLYHLLIIQIFWKTKFLLGLGPSLSGKCCFRRVFKMETNPQNIFKPDQPLVKPSLLFLFILHYIWKTVLLRFILSLLPFNCVIFSFFFFPFPSTLQLTKKIQQKKKPWHQPWKMYCVEISFFLPTW